MSRERTGRNTTGRVQCRDTDPCHSPDVIELPRLRARLALARVHWVTPDPTGTPRDNR